MKIAVMGYGTIGSGVVEVLEINKEKIAKRAGKPIEVKKQRPTDEKVAELNDIVKAEIQKLMDDYKK